jgi:hypothetical protein
VSAILLALIGEVLDIILGLLTKNPDQPPIISKLLAKIIPLFSRVAGETPEQTEERRKRAEAIFAAHSEPIVGAKP